jgi:hypothetical protein
MPSPMIFRPLFVALLASVAALLPASAPVAGATCAKQTLEFGIAKAEGCFNVDANAYKTTEDVDLNGFTFKATAKEPLWINTTTRHVTTKGKKIGFKAGTLVFDDTAFNFNVPNSGKLLITWMFTPEGQEAIAETGYYPTMPDGPAPGDYPSISDLDLLEIFLLDEVNEVATEHLDLVESIFQ